MIREAIALLSDWSSLDTWIVVTAALAAMACAAPGVWLLLRRQSMMGDALSHTVLPGIVIAFLLKHELEHAGWLGTDPIGAQAIQHIVLFGGAMLMGVFSAVLTEWIQKLGRVESSASLGVVFTSLFALGLVLIRAQADSVHLDPHCVLYGVLETVLLDSWGDTGIPRAAVISGGVWLANLALIGLFYKELRISAFDPALATTVGIHARLMHYGLMALTAATLVSAFETVGSILVIAMLIVPAATAFLLTNRLSTMILLSQLIAVASAVIGHAMAKTLPAMVFGRLGYPDVRDASTSGMLAVACGMLFVLALLFSPRHGVLSRFGQRWRLGLRIVGEDVLGLLYRLEEQGAPAVMSRLDRLLGTSRLKTWLAIVRLRRRGWVAKAPLAEVATMRNAQKSSRPSRGDAGYQLTEAGREAAKRLVRSHRLWESYVSEHFALPQDHVHESAARVEHYLDPALREELASELQSPRRDPHGRTIPPEAS